MLNVNANVATRVNGPNTNELQPSLMKNTSILGQAMVSMEDIMALFTELAKGKFEQMEKKSALARAAKDAVIQLDAQIAGMKDGDKAKLPSSVGPLVNDKNFVVLDKSGKKTFDEFTYSNTDAGPHLKKMDEKIQEAGTGGMQSKEWQGAVRYMDKKGIKHNGKKVSDHIWTSPEVGSRSGQKVKPENMQGIRETLAGSAEYSKADLEVLKKSLESASDHAADFVQQNQLKLQQLLQNFNAAVTMAQSLQSMNGESTKAIAQAIR